MRLWSPLLLFIAGSACSASPAAPPPAPPAPTPSTTAEPAASATPPASATPDPDPLAGPLTPDAIQRVIRAHFGRFRLCFENNLRTSPNLQNRVAVQFVIGKDGAVESAHAEMKDTTLASAEGVQCVVEEMKTLRFPKPAKGTMRVLYPIDFSPGS